MARFRLAQILLDENAYDEALRAIDVKTDEGFAAIYADLKGDILATTETSLNWMLAIFGVIVLARRKTA